MIIPSHPKYDISEEGVVTHILSGDILPERRNVRGIRSVVFDNRGHKSVKPLARLMLQTFKPVSPNLSDDWLSVKFLDGNKDNIVLSNLEWDSSIYEPEVIPGVTHPSHVWVPVYGVDNFEIRFNNGVEFRNSRTGNLYSCNVKPNGYLGVICPDGKHRDVHRLVALTFLHHPHDVDHMEVNHKDSDCQNNVLTNLEWVTHAENIKHSHEFGIGGSINKSMARHLKTNKERRVLLQSLDDFIVTGYPSVREAARFLNTNPGHIHSLCTHRQRRGLGYKGFLIKFEDDPTPWADLRKDVSKNQEPYCVVVKCTISGEEIIYDSLMDCVKGETINPKTIYRLLWNDIIVPWNYKYIQAYKENMTWPNYPPEIIDVFSRARCAAKPLKVTYEDGKIEYVTGAKEWIELHPEYRIGLAPLTREIVRAGEWKGIRFEIIDLKDYQ